MPIGAVARYGAATTMRRLSFERARIEIAASFWRGAGGTARQLEAARGDGGRSRFAATQDGVGLRHDRQLDAHVHVVGVDDRVLLVAALTGWAAQLGSLKPGLIQPTLFTCALQSHRSTPRQGGSDASPSSATHAKHAK